MLHCEICHEDKEERNFFAYRRECRECRKARKLLKKERVSFNAMKKYLDSVGVTHEPQQPKRVAKVEKFPVNRTA